MPATAIERVPDIGLNPSLSRDDQPKAKLRYAFLLALSGVLFFFATVWLVHPDYLGEKVWDENWYSMIAESGYTLNGDSYLDMQRTPFPPGLPLLTRVVMWVSGWPYPAVRSILSALLFVLGFLGVHKVLALYSDQGSRHYWALAFFVYWPGSAFFLTGYSESLYFPLLAWCLYALLRQRMVFASMLAAAALFTRSPAIILAPLLVIGCVQRARERGPLRKQILSLSGSCLGCLGIMSVGTLAYMAILWVELGDPFAFTKGYAGWVPYVHTGLDKVLWQSLVPSLFWSYSWPLSVWMALILFVTMPLVVFPRRREMPMLLLAFLVIGWCFFKLMDRHHRPYTDILRWLVIFFPLAYCWSSWTEIWGKKIGAGLALLRIGDSELNARHAHLILNLAILGFLLCHQAYIISRYIQDEWVS